MNKDLSRYARQIAFKPFGPEGQKRLADSSVLIIGVGGLGSRVAEILVRAGIGRLRLVDDDYVDLTNIHRQSLFTEKDAADRVRKVTAAANRLCEINSDCKVATAFTRFNRLTAQGLVEGIDVLIDGTDNFPARFLINDCAIKKSRPWVFAGVLGTESQIMTIIPGKTPCLRCLFPSPPACDGQTCRQMGVLGPAVAAAAAFEASEALKILSGHPDKAGQSLLVFDLWNNTLKQIDLSKLTKNPDCPCCVHGNYEFLGL
ncbi:MAG: HesA/MoeB/ThiF family protein [Sedimentisphaerales bacterium]|nr:HesA/MoeB/ThiF family protein [Sedimentisphaerales bacterium]